MALMNMYAAAVVGKVTTNAPKQNAKARSHAAGAVPSPIQYAVAMAAQTRATAAIFTSVFMI